MMNFAVSNMMLAAGIQDMIFPIMAILALFYVMFIIPERRKQKKRESSHKDRMENLKKNDRIQTIGGIRGVVVNVKREDNEVVVRIDETTNTKMRFDIASIASVEGDSKEAKKENKENKTDNPKLKANV